MIPQPGRIFPGVTRFTQCDFSAATARVRELEREFD
jgi:hypothetical protein